MFLIVFIAFLYGCATVISKMINYRAAQELGTWNGSLVNYVVASILALALLLFSPYLWSDLQACTKVPVYLYAGGTFGVIAFVLSIVTLRRMKVFQSTILLLAGQLLGQKSDCRLISFPGYADNPDLLPSGRSWRRKRRNYRPASAFQ